VYTNDLDTVNALGFDENNEPIYEDRDDYSTIGIDRETVDVTDRAHKAVLEYINSKGYEIDAIKKMREYAGDA
jgi:hypothetical protein